MQKFAGLLFGLLCLVCLWQLMIIAFHLPDFILPSPWQVLLVYKKHYALLFKEAIPTCIETGLGFIFGILLGCVCAILIYQFRFIALVFLPLLIISQALPTFAIAPLLVIWLGYGLAAKVVTTIIMVFFPVTSAFYDGLKRVNPDWLDLSLMLKATRWQAFYHFKLPAALPSLASGIRLAAVAAPIGAIIGEWVGATKGLGLLMLNANARLQIDMMFAALLVIIMLSLTLYYVVNALLNRLIWWD